MINKDSPQNTALCSSPAHLTNHCSLRTAEEQDVNCTLFCTDSIAELSGASLKVHTSSVARTQQVNTARSSGNSLNYVLSTHNQIPAKPAQFEPPNPCQTFVLILTFKQALLVGWLHLSFLPHQHEYHVPVRHPKSCKRHGVTHHVCKALRRDNNSSHGSFMVYEHGI